MLRPLASAPDFLAGGAVASRCRETGAGSSPRCRSRRPRRRRWPARHDCGDAGRRAPGARAARRGGTLDWIAPSGSYAVEEPIARIDGAEISLLQRWPVRSRGLTATGSRPTCRSSPGSGCWTCSSRSRDGSTAAVPGGFGTGKTLLLQQIAKWCDADVIVYVGCGERGNEMADVLDELRRLDDPRTGGRCSTAP